MFNSAFFWVCITIAFILGCVLTGVKRHNQDFTERASWFLMAHDFDLLRVQGFNDYSMQEFEENGKDISRMTGQGASNLKHWKCCKTCDGRGLIHVEREK